MKKRYSLALWLCFTAVNLVAQQFHWANFRLPNVLGDAQPRVLHESQDGLIWLATSTGLCSFDGNSFNPIPRRDSLPADARAVFEDRENTLWIGYANGSVDRLQNGQLEPWAPEEGLPAAAITGFSEDDAGQLWISTYGEGAYVIAGPHLYNFNTDDGLLGNDIYTIVNHPNGEIWLGTDGGISICKFNKGQKSVTNLTRDDGLPDEIVRVIHPDKAGNCWIGTHDKGMAYFDLSAKTFHTPVKDWPYGPINDLILVEGRELIIATENHSGWRLNLKTNLLLPLSSVSEKPKLKTKIEDLLQDAEGGLWLLSNSKGLFRTNQQLAFVEAIGREIQAVRLDQNGKLWAGTDRGLYSLAPNGELLPFLPAGDLNIVSLFEDRYGNLWLGTFGDGAYILNPASGGRRHLGQEEGLLNGSILSIDGKGDHLWLASLGGVAEVILKANPLDNVPLSFRKIKGLKTDFIYQVLAESPDRVWFATDGEGLALLDHGDITHLRTTQTVTGDSIDLRRVYSISASATSHLWLNTAREGLFSLVNDSLYAHISEKALSGENITSLALTGASKLIVSHTEGLAMLNLTTGDYQNIHDNQTEGPDYQPILNAVTTGPQGQVWFGCSGGLMRYQDVPHTTVTQPRIVLQSASIYPNNEPEPNGKRFTYDKNTLAFDFFGLWYTAPDKVRCRYQLEGYDPGWSENKNQRVIYSKLAPGNYSFRVAASASDDWTGASIKSYNFSIASPIWQRWWFILLALGAGILLVSYLIRRRDRQLRRESLLEKQRIESQYEALKSQINPHFLFNSFNTLVAMIEEAPADAVTYTEKLSNLFRNVLQYRDQETIPIKEELDLLADYLFLLDKRFGSKLDVTIQLDGKTGFIVPLSLQFLMENAIKHNIVSMRRPLHVRISASKNGKHICVHNPIQLKLRKEPSTGFGLLSLKERYALLTRDKMIIQETEEDFRVCIPILHSFISKT